jgi:hypothetical protein
LDALLAEVCINFKPSPKCPNLIHLTTADIDNKQRANYFFQYAMFDSSRSCCPTSVAPFIKDIVVSVEGPPPQPSPSPSPPSPSPSPSPPSPKSKARTSRQLVQLIQQELQATP